MTYFVTFGDYLKSQKEPLPSCFTCSFYENTISESYLQPRGHQTEVCDGRTDLYHLLIFIRQFEYFVLVHVEIFLMILNILSLHTVVCTATPNLGKCGLI